MLETLTDFKTEKKMSNKKWTISTEVAGNLEHTKIYNEKGIAILSMHRLPFSKKEKESNSNIIVKCPEMLEILERILILTECGEIISNSSEVIQDIEKLIKDLK